jgi:hypothetical protein
MLALEGPQVCATGATTPGGRDCASDEAARASSMVAWPDMVDMQAGDTLLIVLQRKYKRRRNKITYSSYLCTSPPPSYLCIYPMPTAR